MAKIEVEVEGKDSFECDEELFNLGMMMLDMLKQHMAEDAAIRSESMAQSMATMLAKLPKPEIKMPAFPKMEAPVVNMPAKGKLRTSEIQFNREWRQMMTGFTMAHKYDDDEESE
jgi:hypothetical protein